MLREIEKVTTSVREAGTGFGAPPNGVPVSPRAARFYQTASRRVWEVSGVRWPGLSPDLLLGEARPREGRRNLRWFFERCIKQFTGIYKSLEDAP